MKRLSYTLAAFTLGAFLLVGCAKENNKYDKILTEGTWTVSTMEMNEEEVIFDDSSVDPDETTTSTTNISVAGGKRTSTYSDVSAVVGTTNSTEVIELEEDFSSTMTFTEEGIYSSSLTNEITNYKNVVDGVVIFDGGVTTDPSTSTVSDIWAWANTANTKTQITFDGATYNITVEKGKITLTISTSSETVEVTSATNTQTVTRTMTTTIVATR
jgi:hypothetical protein